MLELGVHSGCCQGSLSLVGLLSALASSLLVIAVCTQIFFWKMGSRKAHQELKISVPAYIPWHLSSMAFFCGHIALSAWLALVAS